MPPELEASSAAKPIVRSGKSVPEEVLHAIQACFVAPATHYQCSHTELLAGYRKAVELSRKAIAEHGDAPDLWMVRNRLIVALMGLWKTEGRIIHLEDAFVEAKTALEAGYPSGCDWVARFCLARQALRSEGVDSAVMIDAFVVDAGRDEAPGSALAVVAQLALDVGDRYRFERSMEQILKQHSEDPMMWLYAASLIDRHHDYWRFRMPFYIGYSHPRREQITKHRGEEEDCSRMLVAELVDAEGKVFRIPEDLTKDYTAIFFSKPAPWSQKRGDGLTASPLRLVSGFNSGTKNRPHGEVQTMLVMLGDEPHPMSFKDRKGRQVNHSFDMMALPGGLQNPLVHRLGMLFGNGGINSVLVDKEGRILTAISGLGRQSTIGEYALPNLITGQDTEKVDALLEKGDVEAAKKYILSFAPESADGKVSEACDDHLRARARVYRALGELDKALADIKVLIKRQQMVAHRSSERTDQLIADEAFRDSIREQLKK